MERTAYLYFLFESNAHRGTITGFRVSSSGNLSLLQRNGLSADPGGATLDMVFSADGKYLYVLVGNSAGVVEYQVGANGELTKIGKVGLPAGSVGLALG